jgi:SAM-dependent methyltransferase
LPRSDASSLLRSWREAASRNRDWGTPLPLQILFRLRRPAILGTLRRTRPLSDVWGFDRGTPIDRYYIERFLWDRRADIHGRCLELMDNGYTDLYGTDVTAADVLDIDASNPKATIVDDLTIGELIPADTYDCFILTQTLNIVYDVRGALRTAHRVLRPGGVLLVTVPAVSRVWRPEQDFWRFTDTSIRLLVEEAFGDRVQAKAYGNVLTGIAFLAGMASQELTRRELATNDPRFPVTIAVRAVKG